jgi:hypothetical protein
VAAPFAIGWIVVHPWQNVPVIDDWTYAWSVERLLEAHQLRVPEISAVYPISQILWGALFGRILGFSFGALRLSTVVLAVVGCWSLYLTLRELKIGAAVSLLAALTMAVHPVFFALAFTFMTDVPFVSLASLALYFYVSAVERDRPARLWPATLFALVAFLVRPIAVALPVAALAALWRRPNKPASLTRRLAIHAAMGIVAATAISLWLPRLFGPLSGQALRLEGLRSWFLVPGALYATWNVNLWLIAAFPLAPLLLATVTDRGTIVRVALVSLALAAALTAIYRSVPTPLPDWQTWSLQDIAARAMIGGTVGPSALSVRLTPVVKAAGMVVVAALLVALARAPRAAPSGGCVLLALGAINLVLMNVLWFYNDRYYLALVPTIAYIAAIRPIGLVGRWFAGAGLALWLFVGVTGARDMLAVNAACQRLARELEADGVAPSEIDAGYSLNGWRLYVHSENLPPGSDPRDDVPFVTSTRKPLYRILIGPEPGYDVVRVERLQSAVWQVTDRLYVARRRD